MTNTTNAPVPSDRLAGSVLGLAYGDAIGDPVEFRKYAEIVADGGARIPSRLRVTDDTQMSLAVWSALEAWTMPGTLGDRDRSLGWLRMELSVTFDAWYHDRDNDRAPGNTCMSALARLARMGLGRWTSATSPDSAGCGSVMRAAWVGLHPKLSDEMVARVAMLQAVLTHGPAENAYVAAALADLTRALARDEVSAAAAPAWLADWADERAGWSYDDAALSDLWYQTRRSDDRSRYGSREDYHADGVAHVRWVAQAAGALAARLTDDPWGFDPCEVAGEGWRAREAVALAVGILAGFADRPEEFALLRAAQTNGDSDSIGAITGALVGAAAGNVWSAGLFSKVEPRYQHELAAVIG